MVVLLPESLGAMQCMNIRDTCRLQVKAEEMRFKGEDMRTQKRMAMSKKDLQKGVPVVDTLPIRFEKLDFALDKGVGPILQGIDLDLEQGTLPS